MLPGMVNRVRTVFPPEEHSIYEREKGRDGQRTTAKDGKIF
jgi:hypothetical protein